MSDIAILPRVFTWFIFFGLATCLILPILLILALYGLARRSSERRRVVAVNTHWLPRTWWVGFVLLLANAMLALLSTTGSAGSQSNALPGAIALAWIPLNATVWIFCLVRSRRNPML
ncbi:hypothetical protein [Paraburkholderia bryophila]|uniref:Transmembrane protein n=1 Tax=Paraburkholderia bryophila TaxID=420952 RepID=A0A7Y9WLB5_9BURK|nr:hypothetical protein [Paraburkholderia bryophila]NYH23035.1 hypothetical protein [Paraburkholderia bryophila]